MQVLTHAEASATEPVRENGHIGHSRNSAAQPSYCRSAPRPQCQQHVGPEGVAEAVSGHLRAGVGVGWSGCAPDPQRRWPNPGADVHAAGPHDHTWAQSPIQSQARSRRQNRQ